jgi:YegS/Rv2252/BmrU family lipid kinase
MPRALLIVNSRASQAADCRREITACLESGRIEVVQGEAESEECYRECLQKEKGRVDMLVVAGGDGTVRCAAEALLAETSGAVPLGIIALGTANNVARSLELPLHAAKACQVITAGHRAPMDLARVNGRIFVSVVGIGLSTQVHEQVPSEQKKKWGSLSYAVQAVKLLWRRPRAFRVRIEHQNGVVNSKALQVTICNGRYYGAHLEIQPEATLQDGLLDVSIVEAGNFVKGMFKTLLPLRPGHSSPGLRLLQSSWLQITTQPVAKIDVEGATDLRTPARFEVIPGAVQVFTTAPGK